VVRPALVLAALGALGVGATLGAPTALAGADGLAPRVAQAAGAAHTAPPAAPGHQAPAFGARPAAPPAAAAPVPAAPALASGPATSPAGGTLGLASVSGPTESAGRVEASPAAGLRVASLAQTQLGARYVWGGSSPAGGFDCSGFVYWAFGQAGHPISRVMTEQFASGRRVRLEELQPGDVLFYQNTYTAGLSHDGIYVGDDKFIHVADESIGVVLTPLHSAYWEQHFAGAVRITE
jgi:cell wall-associated NlpC family hydrolase